MSLTVTLLGTGTSAGIPMIGCTCRTCTSPDPRDRRDRPGAMVQYTGAADQPRTVLLDTPLELRSQMIRHRVMRIDGVLYTHNHADHVFGLDDLRRFNAVMGQAIDIYGEQDVIDWIRRTFDYIFQPHMNVNNSFIATLQTHTIRAGEPFELAGRQWTPVRLMHGRIPIAGYRVGDFAYCTDCSEIPPESMDLLADLDVLAIDALRYRPHPTHMTVDQALAAIDKLKPRRAYLTHIAHDVLHGELETQLPEHVNLAYDGLTIEVAGED